MKRFVLVLTLLMPVICRAQSIQPNALKGKDDVRYEIVQSTLAIRQTFKLDTYTGDVYLLVHDDAGKNLWQHMTREYTLHPDPKNPDSRNYSIFVSTLGTRYTFLINVHSGTTWQLFEDTDTKALFFKPMDDE
jgi:hypothetical protein